MDLLGGVGQMEAHFDLFRYGVDIGARFVHGLGRMCNRVGNHFGHTRLNASVTWVKWKRASVHLQTVLISEQDRCTVSVNIPQAHKLFWAHPMKLLGDVGQLEACFGLFADRVNHGARQVHDLCRMYHTHGNLFGHTRGTSKVMWVKWKLVLVCSGIV
jgi:hypothetical protein